MVSSAQKHERKIRILKFKNIIMTYTNELSINFRNERYNYQNMKRKKATFNKWVKW